MSKTVTFSSEIAAILRKSEITATALKLPSQLSREDYMAVNKVIVAAGGTWNRKAGAHLFTRDPRATFAEALGSGEDSCAGSIPKAPNAILDVKKARQAYYTPAPVIGEIVELVRKFSLSIPERFLEPSAGDGRLVRAVLDAYPSAKASVCEIDDLERAKAAEWGAVIGTDFLAVSPVAEYDLVVMNPPFSGGQDEAHIMHAKRFLRPGGLLVSVCTPMTGKRATKKSQQFNDDIGQYGWRIKLASGSFKTSGTGVEAEIFMIRV